jgi:hypothetical protein
MNRQISFLPYIIGRLFSNLFSHSERIAEASIATLTLSSSTKTLSSYSQDSVAKPQGIYARQCLVPRCQILFSSLGLNFFFVLLSRGFPLVHCKYTSVFKKFKRLSCISGCFILVCLFLVMYLPPYQKQNKTYNYVLDIYREDFCDKALS